MNNNHSKKNNLFAVIALMCTLGITIAGFIWLHVEPPTSESVKPRLSLDEKIQLLDARLDHQQATIQDLEERTKRLENFNQQIKTAINPSK